jgi:hypothetical protein
MIDALIRKKYHPRVHSGIIKITAIRQRQSARALIGALRSVFWIETSLSFWGHVLIVILSPISFSLTYHYACISSRAL